jgi:hypothetical protein
MELPAAQTLLAVGVCLVMAGVVLRGFATSARREIARRKQHRSDERKSADAHLSGELDKPPGWFERHLGFIANSVLILGAIIAIIGFARF